uniref:ELYS-like domain-containing protein n=1 Tax=Kalanchoe fedtschenkoi TaxID=63787 RepID=A0A7N0RF81_KALFE
MERKRTDSRLGGSGETEGGGGSSARATGRIYEPNYRSRAVQEALDYMATIDLVELCNEAKVEYCRATRDLRSCGRNVEYVLNSCNHASLCAECSQRCDVCPICRVPISKNGTRLRLYYECVEAKLIPEKFNDPFRARDDDEKQVDADIQRLYSLFDVALKNNLVSLICHYVTDVCMDESAVSSDPVIAFLLDEVVVKDWCKRRFKSAISEIRAIYSLTVEEMKASVGSLLQVSGQLSGISNVLEVLESSFKGAVSAQLEDLHHLQESILKSKQHLEIIIWCIRHQFLENLKPRFTNYSSWRAHVRDRKSAATKRAMSSAIESTIQEGSLFIEDALLNLEGEVHPFDIEDDFDVKCLQKDSTSSNFRSKIDGSSGSYPFENLRAACDILFLHGSSDLVVAKRAIFLYYLFDRHWSMPNEKWKHIVDDFAASFGLGRHSLLESFIFYLLDDHSDEALQEACRLLPEIAGSSTHPKVAQVLLERQNPDAALMVLRWSGRDGGPELVSLTEAVIAVRVRVLSGLLTEAFLYQRMICNKVQEKYSKPELHMDCSNGSSNGSGNWVEWLETLVTELCCLCLWRNFVDQIIDLPWNSAEEKYLHKCLLEYAMDHPTSSVGSLLVTYYLKRYRYVEAYQVDQILKSLEEEFISKSNADEQISAKMKSVRAWRTGLIDKCLELLPEIQRQQVKSGKIPDKGISPSEDVDMQTNSDTFKVQETHSTSILLRPAYDSSFDHGNSPRSKTMASSILTPNPNHSTTKFPEHVHGPLSVLQEQLFANTGSALKPQMGISRNMKFDDTPATVARRFSLRNTLSTRKVEKTPSRSLMNNYFHDSQNEVKQNGFTFDQPETISTPYAKSIPNGLDKRSGSSPDEAMDISWSNGGGKASPENVNADTNSGLRWRTDESSEEEDTQTPQRTPSLTRRARRSRFARV